MASSQASMVGAGIFKEFVEPYYRRIAAVVQRQGVPVFSVDSDGNASELTGWFRDCGVTLVGPNQVDAGNDIVAYRRRFGRTMAFDGGLDKRVLTRGRDAIDAMLESIVPAMKATGGGWIACLDLSVLPGTSLKDFTCYVQRLQELVKG
jgi:uroporphyrinogen decarboxylase